MSKKVTRYSYNKLGIKKGSVFSFLEPEIENWLIDLAVQHRSSNVSEVIMAILNDAHFEETTQIFKSNELN